MTCKEAIIAICKPYTVADDAIALALLNNNLNAGDAYTVSNKQAVYTAAYECLRSLLSIASISEGGYSITFKPEQLQSKMVTVAYQSGNKSLMEEADQLKPTVTSRKVW